MYICAINGTVSKPGELAYKIVTERRPKEYKTSDGYVFAKGWEVVKEIMVCKQVYDQMILTGED